MAKVTISGRSYAVKSRISYADLELTAKHRPEALTIVDSETKEERFRVGVGKDAISQYGISFGATTGDESKAAVFTALVPENTEDIKAFVTEQVGPALIGLETIENRLSATDGTLEKIRSEQNRISNAITFVG